MIKEVMKIDPYHHKERYLAWKEKLNKALPNMSKENSEIILQYIEDMELGMNVSAKNSKGARSYIRLNTIRDKTVFFAKKFKQLYNLDPLTTLNEEQLIRFFSSMKNGTLKKERGGEYKSVDYYAKCFKAFWHWWMKINRKKGIEIQDITVDLDTRQDKPSWVYLTEEEVKRLCDNAKYEYKVLIMFLLDTGIRAPTELMNVRVSDFFNNFKELQIREEISKTFGRRIKLMLSSDYIKNYIKKLDLKTNDCLFQVHPSIMNQYLKRLAVKILGEGVSPAGARYSELTMYDFRHVACCYWLPRYKSESALKYRFGWKKSDKIHYYSELLGMKDTISEEDLLVDVTKTEIEKQMHKTQNENELLQERLRAMEMQMAKIMEVTKRIEEVRVI